MSDPAPLARKLHQQNHSTLLRAVAELSQAVVAERSGLSPTLVSRLLAGKDGEEGAVDRVLAIAAACNLQLVPKTYQAVDPDEYRAMQILARRRLDDATNGGTYE